MMEILSDENNSTNAEYRNVVDTNVAEANSSNIRNKSEYVKINGVVSVKFERKVANV